MLLWIYTYVSGLRFKCFRCFRLMLQVFHLDVIKVDLNVAYIGMAIHACFKCFICFRYMLQMFCLDVSKVDLVLHMLQWHRWLAGSGLPQLPAAVGTPCGRQRLADASVACIHRQEQVIGTHVCFPYGSKMGAGAGAGWDADAGRGMGCGRGSCVWTLDATPGVGPSVNFATLVQIG
jgi:hypothetical protein